ncbi:MAG: hypothetical protein ACK51K_15270 [Gammaproteobacteria bacterium]
MSASDAASTLPPAVRPAPPVHEDVGAAVAAVIPPRRVPLQKRLFWSTVLLLLRFPRGRAWLASRQRR